MKVLGAVLLVLGMAGTLAAVSVPEIDPATGGNALALVAGTLLVIRSRRNR